MSFGPKTRAAVREMVDALVESEENRKAQIPVLLNALIAGGKQIEVIYTTGHWLDIDSVADIVKAGAFRMRGENE